MLINKRKYMIKIRSIISIIVVFILLILYLTIHIYEDNKFFYKLKLHIPFKVKDNIKTFLFPLKLREERDIYKNLLLSNDKIFNTADFTFNIKKKSELKKIKNLIMKDYILNKDQTDFKIVDYKTDFNKKFLNHENFIKNADIYKIKYYNINNYAFHHKANDKCKIKKLIIYSNGHSFSAYDHQDFLDFKKKAVEKCYDFFVIGMTGLGFNAISNNSFPSQIDNTVSTNLEIIRSFYDKEFPNKKPLSLMLTGNYYLITNFLNENKYENIYMVGLSGGGWYTTFLSSLITNIDASFSIAGTLPLIFYLNSYHNSGTWEQDSSEIYNHLDYIDLYILSTMNEKFYATRKHFQIYNSKDRCCFLLPATSKFKKIFEKLKIKNVYIYIWENNEHSIVVDKLIKILEDKV